MGGKDTLIGLNDLCEAIVDCEHKTAPTQSHGIPSIRTTDIKNGRLGLANANKVSEETYREWTARIVPGPGDLILAREAPVGEVGIIPPDTIVCLGQRTVLIRPDLGKLVPRYLLYLLLTAEMRHKITCRAEGSTVPHLNMSDIRSLEIPTPPPLDEQKTIAHILGTLDDKIELNRQMNKTLEAMAEAIFKSWFVDFDPVTAEANPQSILAFFPDSFEDSPLGPIPKGWQVVRLDTTATVVDCLHSKKPRRQTEGWLLLQVYNVGNTGRLDMSNRFLVSEDNYREWTKRIEVAQGDLVITKTGRVGAVAQVPHGIKAGLGRNMVGIRPRPERTTPCFLKDCLLSAPMMREIEHQTLDGTILRSLHVKAIEALRLVLPPHELLTHYEAAVSAFHDRVEVNDEESRTLAAIRDALLPKLMSGEIRVRDAENMEKNS